MRFDRRLISRVVLIALGLVLALAALPDAPVHAQIHGTGGIPRRPLAQGASVAPNILLP